MWKEYVFLLPGVIMEDSGTDVQLKTLLLLFSCMCASSSLSHLYEHPRYLS